MEAKGGNHGKNKDNQLALVGSEPGQQQNRAR